MSTVRAKDYVHYIQSFDWYLVSRAALERAGFQCQRCGALHGLEVHHLNYDNLGHE